MKTVTSIKKYQSYMSVIFDDEITLEIQPELMIKYHVSLGKTIDDDTYQELVDENLYLSCLRAGLKALKKMMTVQEMTTFLNSKGYGQKVIHRVISYLIEKKYLDDFQYAKMYISLKNFQQGPQMMIFKLTEKGVNEKLIYKALSTYNEYDIVSKVCQSKLKQMKKKTKKQAFQTVKSQLLSKGFHLEIIDAVLLESQAFYTSDEKKLLELAYEKAYKTLHVKYTGYELEQKLKEKLYQKGFAYEDIKSYIEQKKLHSW